MPTSSPYSDDRGRSASGGVPPYQRRCSQPRSPAVSGIELQPVKLVIRAAQGEQLLVPARFDDDAILQHDDVVGV
jgi:hypothetical protein